MNKIAAAVLTTSAIALSGCAIPTTSPQPAVTVTKEATPSYTAPTPSYTPEYSGLLELAWTKIDSSSKQDMCVLYNASPDMFWAKWSETMTGDAALISRATVMSFFSRKC